MINILDMQKQVRVGIGVIIYKGDEVLLGLRQNSHGHDQWAFPGGHLEFNESPEECAMRETLEETGLQVANVRRGPWTNDFYPDLQKHYITLFMLADHVAGDPQVLETDKCKEWCWFPADQLPSPLFTSLQNLKESGYCLCN